MTVNVTEKVPQTRFTLNEKIEPHVTAIDVSSGGVLAGVMIIINLKFETSMMSLRITALQRLINISHS